MKCFYHNADLDGICSREIVRKYAYNEGLDCDFIGLDYGDFYNWASVRKELVVIVDYCPEYDLNEINEHNDLIWIDHHQSAIDKYKGDNIRGIQEVGKAACELAWEYFFPGDNMPESVKFLGRYDVWDHGYSDDVLPFQYYMRSKSSYLQLWMNLLNRDDVPVEYIETGKHIHSYAVVTANDYCRKNCMVHKFNGMEVLVLCGVRGSTAFEAMNGCDYDAMLAYNIVSGMANVSLYMDNNRADILGICTEFGGGGHPNACGFRMDAIEFLKKLGPAI